MIRISHKLAAFAAILSLSFPVFPQLALTADVPSGLIDFEAGIVGVSSGAFDGTGFSPEPLEGQLDSDAWSVLGFSDGDLAFGGSAASGDLARGSLAGGGTSTGGLYALTDFPLDGGSALAVQPGGTDFTPGAVTLRLVNADASQVITSLAVSYDIYERNDADRSSSLTFSFSADGKTFTPVPALDHATVETASPSPAFIKIGSKGPSRSHTIAPLTVVPGGQFYMRWEGDDLSGTGSRDEIALDNIAVAAAFLGTTAAVGSIAGRVVTEDGRPVAFARIGLTGELGGERAVHSNQFGRFEFRELPVGEVYFLSAASGRYSFAVPFVTVVLEKKLQYAEFVAREIGGSAGKR